jgi:hypothetical protein
LDRLTDEERTYFDKVYGTFIEDMCFQSAASEDQLSGFKVNFRLVDVDQVVGMRMKLIQSLNERDQELGLMDLLSVKKSKGFANDD